MSTRFHRLARETPQYAWWKLPLTGIVAFVGYVAATVGLIVWVMVALFATVVMLVAL